MGAEILGILLIAPVWASWKALNLPSFRPLQITSVYRGEGGLDTMEWRKYGHGHGTWEHDEHGMTRYVGELKEVPPMLVISGKNGFGHNWDIAIDLNEGTVGAIDWGDLTHYQYGGSGEIGLFIFGLPGIILTSPLWLTTNAIRWLIGRFTPLNVEHWEVWLKLRGQLKEWNIDPWIVWRALRLHQAGVPNSHNERRHAEYKEEQRQEKLAKQFNNWKDDYIDGPFMDRMEHGCAEESEVMDDYEDWQRRQSVDQNVRAHQWLGMTEAEFESWRSQKKTILQLLEDRDAARQSSQEQSRTTPSS